LALRAEDGAVTSTSNNAAPLQYFRRLKMSAEGSLEAFRAGRAWVFGGDPLHPTNETAGYIDFLEKIVADYSTRISDLENHVEIGPIGPMNAVRICPEDVFEH
jgi:hypothetical protein